MASPTVRPPEPQQPPPPTTTGIKTVRTMLEQMKGQIQMALPRHITADRMIRVALTSVQKNEKLLQCAPVTLAGAIVQLAQLGLEPDDGTGKAYLIPFWNGRKGRMEVQAMPGYRGLVQLARNSGEVRDVIPHEVYTNDTFDYKFGTDAKLTHVPFNGEGTRGKITHVYAIATYKDNGQPSFDVMTVAQVEEIHKKVIEKNKGADSAVWREHYDEMAKKTVVRRLCKYLPSSPELQKAVALDEKAEFAIPQDLGSLILPELEKASEVIDAPPAPQRLSEATKPQAAAAAPAAPAPDVPRITPQQKADLDTFCRKKNVSPAELDDLLLKKYGITGRENIPQAVYPMVCEWIETGQIRF